MSRLAGGAAAALIEVLEVQRKRLRDGDVRELAGELEAVERLSAELAATAPPDETLHRLRDCAARNAALLEAGTRGVRAVRRRLRELGEDRRSETYTADGERVAMSACRFGDARLG